MAAVHSEHCNISPQRNGLIKLPHYDETKKMARDSQIVRAKENRNLSHDGLSQRQTSDNNQLVKALRQGHHWVWGLAHGDVQLPLKVLKP